MPRIITTSYPGICADCGATIPEGAEARYYGRGRIYGIGCHEKGDAPKLAAALETASIAASEAYKAYVAEYYTVPAFAVVENSPDDMFHNPGKPTEVIDTMFDVCGFVWVNIDNRRNNGAPGKRFLTEFKNHATPERDGRHWRLGEFSLSHSGYDGSWHLGGYGAASVTGGTGNGAMSAAEAGGKAFVEAMTTAGYKGLRVESRID
jgi:hypothetical protein